MPLFKQDGFSSMNQTRKKTFFRRHIRRKKSSRNKIDDQPKQVPSKLWRETQLSSTQAQRRRYGTPFCSAALFRLVDRGHGAN